MGISEKIFIEFVIDKSGNIASSRVVRGEDESTEPGGYEIIKFNSKDDAAKQRGKPVSVIYFAN